MKTKRKTPAALSGSGGKKTKDEKQELDVARWQDRIKLADKIYKGWERHFQCTKGWDWYEGYQGSAAHLLGDPEQDRYIINLILPTIEVKIPSLYFNNPKATVIPRPGREDDPMSHLQARAQLREDTVNTFMSDPALKFKSHTNLSLKESFFYFGVVMVGYDADFIINPNAGKPIMYEDVALRDDETGEDLVEPEVVATDESVFVKRIPPQNFRMSARADFILENCDWCGYFEWMYASDLKKDPLVENHDKIKATGRIQDDYTGKIDLGETTADGYMNADETARKQGMIKVWFIWDLRAKKRLIVPDSGKFYIQSPKPYKVFPFSAIKHHERKDGWLPMPPHFNWLSPQAELNNTREMQKLHRKRMVRRYQMYKNSMDPDELDKLNNGGDGTIVQTNVPLPAIVPIEDAPLDFAITRNVPQTKEDFMDITATGSDQRQAQAQAETATQATVIETRARIRESFSQQLVSEWITTIAKKLLETIEAHMTLPFWIKRNVDPQAPGSMMESMQVAFTYQEIMASEMGSLNYDVSVAAESLSPINEDLERQQFGEAMTILTSNPTMMIMFRTSDMLLRKFLSLYGMKSEKIVQQVKLAIEVALLAMTAGQSANLPSDQGQSGENAQITAAAGQNPGQGLSGPGGQPVAPSGGGGGASGPSGLNGTPPPGLNGALTQIRAQMGLPS